MHNLRQGGRDGCIPSRPGRRTAGLTEPVLLDEWQQVPGVLGAVKRSVDSDPRAGRFLITGSVRADLEGDTWPGTGRLLRLPLYGMTIGELEARGDLGEPDLLDRLVDGEEGVLEPAERAKTDCHTVEASGELGSKGIGPRLGQDAVEIDRFLSRSHGVLKPAERASDLRKRI